MSPSHYWFFVSDLTIRYYCETNRLVYTGVTDICSNVHEDGSNSVRKIGDLILRGLSETRFGYILCRIAKKRSDSQVLLFCVASHQANMQMVHLLGVEAVVAPKIT